MKNIIEIQKKELELIEAELPELTKKMFKSDTLSLVTFIGALIIFTTTKNNDSVKLPILGFSVKSLYAVYILFAASLWQLRAFVILSMNKMILRYRYLFLFNKIYNEIPVGVKLLFANYGEDIFLFRKNWLYTIISGIIILPPVLLYLYLYIKLISLTFELNYTLLFCLYYIAMAVYLTILIIYILKEKIKPNRLLSLLSDDKPKQ